MVGVSYMSSTSQSMISYFSSNSNNNITAANESPPSVIKWSVTDHVFTFQTFRQISYNTISVSVRGRMILLSVIVVGFVVPPLNLSPCLYNTEFFNDIPHEITFYIHY